MRKTAHVQDRSLKRGHTVTGPAMGPLVVPAQLCPSHLPWCMHAGYFSTVFPCPARTSLFLTS